MKRLSLAMMGLAIAGLMTMVSCRKPVNQFNTTGEKITFSATTENNSKTYAEEISGELNVKWAKGDQISINGNVFTLEGEGGETSGSFTGNVAEAAGYFASYPATNDGSSVTFNVPAEQDNGTNLNGKIPMVAYTTEKGGNLAFKNMVNILQLNLTGTQTINEIEVSSTEENLSGSFTVGTNLTPTVINSGTISNKITVTKSLNLGEGQKTVYVVLPVFGNAESTVTVKFTGDEGEMTGSFELKGSEPGSYATTPNHRYKVAVAVTLVEPVETDEWINFNDATMGVSGLPKWAKKSIGATCSTENTKDPNTAATWYGDYYAWGATTTWYDEGTASSPTWKSDYSDGYVDTNAPYYDFNSACGYNKYTYEGPTTLELSDPCDDAARAVLGGSWRMPTIGEWQQLKENTLFVWTDNYKGISNLKGYVVYKVKETAHKGKVATSSGNGNGNGDCNYSGTAYALTDPHMFLPVAGYFENKGIMNKEKGYYWSSSLNADSPDCALYLYFGKDIDSIDPDASYDRYYGFCVRPVQ